MYKPPLLSAALSVFFLSGCTQATKVATQPEQAKLINQASSLTGMPKKLEAYKFIRVHEGSWLRGNYISMGNEQYPKLMIKWPYAERGATLVEIANLIYANTGVNVELSDDLYNMGKNPNSNSMSSMTTPMIKPPVISTDSTGLVANSSTSPINSLENSSLNSWAMYGVKNPFIDKISFSNDGTLYDLLQMIASKYSISWRYDQIQNKIVFFRTETKMFKLNFPGQSDYAFSLGSSTNEQLSKMQAEVKESSTTWDDVKKTTESMLSRFGTVEIIKNANQLIVKDTPAAIERVNRYVQNLNDVYGRTVDLYVKVIAVKVQNDENFDVSLQNLTQKFSNGDSISWKGGLDPTGTTGSMVATGNLASGRLTGDVIVDALSKRYEISTLKDVKTRAKYNQPAIVKAVQDIAYVSGESYEQGTAGYAGRTSVITSTTETGMNLVMVPRIDNKRNVSLTIGMEISTLVDLRTYPGSLVETPVKDRRIVTQRTTLRNNETYVITSFETNKDQDTRSGVGNENFWLLGGGKQDTAEREVVVVLITPVISGAN